MTRCRLTQQQLCVSIFECLHHCTVFPHLFSYFLIFASHYPPFSHLLCCSHATFPGMVAVVVAAMSKSFPCSLIGGSLFPLQALGVPTAGLCPTPLTPQWVFMLPSPPLHHSIMLPSSGAQGGTGGTSAPKRQPFSCPVPSLALPLSLSLICANRVRYSERGG